MSECSLSGCSQGHVSNFYIVDLENFATAYRPSKHVINLAREREKGGRSDRDKLGRCWSTEFIVPPSSDARPL